MKEADRPGKRGESAKNQKTKQYDRLDDVASILQRMKEVYAIPDWHTRYIATKEFFRAKMTEGSSVQEHGVKMLSLAEKLEDLKAGLDNDTYIDVILQSLPPSYDPFIVNFNMNMLEKSINELINIWCNTRQRLRNLHRRERRGWVLSSSRGQTISAPIAVRKGIGRGIVPIYLLIKVLQRSRKLSKDEVVLRFGDGKAVAAEAVGIINLVISDHVRLELKDCYFVPSMIKNIISIPLLDNAGFEFLINENCFYLMKDGSSHLLGKLNNGLYILQRMKRLVDSKSLEIDNLDNLPACVCGPLNTQARGGFSYFITFTDDHSWYGYVYLMRYKSEAFMRFKEFRLEVENQTGRKIKTLRLDRGGEYLSGELIDYLKENGIVCQWTPPGTPQLNGVGYALETAARLLNIAPSKTVAQTPYQIWHGKPASYKYLRVWGSPAYVKRLVGDKLDSRSSLCRFIGYPKEIAGYYFYDPTEQKVFVSRNAVFLERGFPTDTRRDELLLEESSEAPLSNAGTSSALDISTNNVPILRRSARVPQPPERYGF
ncbi:UNVERIFIED_CONTAM: Retrovirus-related Pol polyprotein from transposon TNT 1-94 [Sesamum calycinum]|uniref:Retrovirus-related Pol polyprotein from transposon TNT 1-94 n=1 Tax=Sesamum calycinum TaxID=2727403 RepID=A0AAW2JAB5_9LAMI